MLDRILDPVPGIDGLGNCQKPRSFQNSTKVFENSWVVIEEDIQITLRDSINYLGTQRIFVVDNIQVVQEKLFLISGIEPIVRTFNSKTTSADF